MQQHISGTNRSDMVQHVYNRDCAIAFGTGFVSLLIANALRGEFRRLHIPQIIKGGGFCDRTFLHINVIRPEFQRISTISASEQRIFYK